MFNSLLVCDYVLFSCLHLSGRLKTSDSELSDTESGKAARVNVLKARIRQASLHLLAHIIKV